MYFTPTQVQTKISFVKTRHLDAERRDAYPLDADMIQN